MDSLLPQIDDYFVVDEEDGVLMFGHSSKMLLLELEKNFNRKEGSDSIIIMRGSNALDPKSIMSTLPQGKLLKKFLQDYGIISNYPKICFKH